MENNSTPKPQDAKYWETRGIDDTERDWGYLTENWVTDYWESRLHEHREVILDELAKFEFSSLAEVGCNAGPNLDRIHDHFKAELFGVDPSPLAVEAAQKHVPYAKVELGTAEQLPWDAQSIDILLYDASLMYVAYPEIEKAMDEMERVAKKGVIIVERYADTKEGELWKGHIWARDYEAILKGRGYTVEKIKVTPEMWPSSKSWQQNGYIFVARVPSGISETN